MYIFWGEHKYYKSIIFNIMWGNHDCEVIIIHTILGDNICVKIFLLTVICKATASLYLKRGKEVRVEFNSLHNKNINALLIPLNYTTTVLIKLRFLWSTNLFYNLLVNIDGQNWPYGEKRKNMPETIFSITLI